VKVIIAGASGFLGSALGRHLGQHGHEVTTLVRRVPATATEIEWHPDRRSIAADVLAGFDAVVCLSGAGIGAKRWTETYKRELRSSRVDPVGTLADAIANLPDGQRPAVFLSGSAMGIYGDRGSQALPESAPTGTGFLCDIAKDWEAAARPAADAGVRVVNLRTSHVLAASGGLLKKLIPIFKLGAGGRFSTGRQYMSWISLADHVTAVRFAMDHETISGPVNLTAGAETNAEFTKALAAALHRPALFQVPKLALRVAIGELADQGAITSQRLVPAVLDGAGFPFQHRDLAGALAWALRH